jgi:hypothetical protein
VKRSEELMSLVPMIHLSFILVMVKSIGIARRDPVSSFLLQLRAYHLLRRNSVDLLLVHGCFNSKLCERRYPTGFHVLVD